MNESGYLINAKGDLISGKNGRVIFEKRLLNEVGEFPKILPFSKFNIFEVCGDLDKNSEGKPELLENEKSETVDKRGRRVNSQGYLIDAEGNILDQKGHRVFDKEILSEEGELPKVFRMGMLRSDSASSLSQLLKDLEHYDPPPHQEDGNNSGFEEEEEMINEELKKMKRVGSGNTSENNSLMGDTPSNYNEANLRF